MRDERSPLAALEDWTRAHPAITWTVFWAWVSLTLAVIWGVL